MNQKAALEHIRMGPANRGAWDYPKTLVAVLIVIMVAMTVAPVPVFLLLLRLQFAEVSVFVTVVFAGPLLVIDHFTAIPLVIVAVVGVVDPVGVMFCASRAQHGKGQGGSEKE
jgi:hypothetical protein